MAYLSSNLIADSYYLSGIVSRDFETPTGGQMSDGLRLLNEVIADRTIDEGTIPYTDKYTLTAVPGTSEYFIEDLIDIDVFVFYIQSVRYQTRNQGRQDYFGSFRATGIQSLPWNWHFERELNGGRLFLYFVPDVAYPLEIWGSFRLTSVTMFQDLSLTLDKFYTNFLLYLLAERLCESNSFTVPVNVEKKLKQYYKWIANTTNVMDLRQQKLSSLSGGEAINYAIVNLSGGWLPVSS
ncbi:MAG TPA: hypothetical protein VJ279_08455 [Hanamia sp.]|jgi:hypothetical protein|nr:hypothetical protein [Hanamia sp.]